MYDPATTTVEVPTIRALIDRMAESRPETVYLLSPEAGLDWTYQELRRQSNRLGQKLCELGCGAGDKIAFMMDNGLFTAGLFLGAMYGGFVPVPLNVRAGRSQLAYMLDHCDAKVVFVSDEYHEVIEELRGEVGRDLVVIRADVDHGPGWEQAGFPGGTLPEVQPDQAAVLIYTSGSTGQPKGALHTHRTFVAGGWNSAIPHELSPADRTLCVLPLYHLNAESVSLLATLLTGGSVVMPHRFLVRSFWEWIAQYRCTWSALVPAFISQLLEWGDPRAEGKGEALERIRFMRSSSAPLAPSLHRAFEEKFGILLLEAMGSTECGGNAFTNLLPPGKDKVGTPGRPYGFETRIVSSEGTEVSPGETGEIHLRGPSIMTGYYKNPEGTSAVLGLDGWLRTGDLAHVDEDGYVFIVGRAKELIIKGGMNIAPRQIDDVLVSHPAVLEAAALGVPDHFLGEDIVAFVTLKSGAPADEQQLLDFCESQLGSFKTPSDIYFVPDLPKGPTGRVQRLRLGECFKEILQVYPRAPAKDSPVDGHVGVGSDSAVLTPRTPIEEIIAETWAGMLKIPVPGVGQNFFGLGGHSLQAIEVLCRLRKQFSVGLSINDFFTKPTVAQQAALVSERLAGDGEAQQEPTPGSTDTAPGRLPTGRDALEEILLQRRSAVIDQAVIPPRDRSSACPLSPAQERLWFLEQLHPGMRAYNEGGAVRLRGRLDIGLLERALNVVIERHEVLRTLIQVVDGQPIQVIQDSWPIPLERIELSALPIQQRDAEVDRLVTEQLRRPFDLTTTPGIRGTVARLDEDDHVFILSMHHIVCDGWSLGIVYRELGAIYRALSRQEPHHLPAPPLQYADYAAWQQQKVARNEFAKEEAFWKEYLDGAPDTLDLPTKQARPGTFTYQGEKRIFSLGRDATERIRSFSRSEGVSLFMTLTAAFDTLLYRYTGQDDVVLGVPFANRDRDELASLFGFLIDFHALRTDLSGNPSFRELLGRVRKGLLDLEENRALPFDKVVEILQPRRDLSRALLFQTLVVWRDRQVQMQFMELDGLTVSYVKAHPGAAKYDLSLYLTDAGDEIWLEVEYCTDLFDEGTIRRMAGHYQRLLEGIVADPGQPISQLPLLTEDERQQMLVEWNDTARAYPLDRCVHHLFEEQAERTPESVAVAFEDRTLTYSQLNARSNQLAHYLQCQGVGPETLVAICMERSLEMVVGLLGILKAGGAYVPLDPEYPAERLAFMLEDAQAPLLLIQRHLCSRVAAQSAQLICLDHIAKELLGYSVDKPLDRATADDLAYVIYTSGSTGKPKGAMNTHRAICNRLLWMQDAYQLTQSDRVLQKTPFSFDVSVWEFFWPLLTGACLVVARPGGHRDSLYLARVIAREEITTLHFVPSLLQIFLDEPEVIHCRGLRRVICSGEALPVDLQERFFARLPRVDLQNLYGPTEAAVDVSYWACRPGEGERSVPIGRPISNMRLYVLDRGWQPLPVEVPGELYIGGIGLARGYWNRPDLTAEKFVPDPLGIDPGGRLYRTGDLVRWRADGNLEFLGRLDDQVKIRGFRIELGEIEASLARHPGLQRSVVVAREDEPGDKRLVAYAVPADSASPPSAADLRSFLGQELPAYMIPSAFAFLDRLPLSPNGKVDRKALPKPGEAWAETSSFIAPRTPVEEILVGIWAEVLGLERIGVADNFFELGGHSLRAIRVIARVHDVLGVEVAMRTFFEAPTVAGMAPAIDRKLFEPAELR